MWHGFYSDNETRLTIRMRMLSRQPFPSPLSKGLHGILQNLRVYTLGMKLLEIHGSSFYSRQAEECKHSHKGYGQGLEIAIHWSLITSQNHYFTSRSMRNNAVQPKATLYLTLITIGCLKLNHFCAASQTSHCLIIRNGFD